MAKKVIIGAKSLTLIKEGVRLFSESVTSTLGPKGRTVLLHRGFGSPHITKDGATVARDVEFEDKVMDMAAKVTREVSQNTADQSGDGSTSSTLLTNAIVQLGFKQLVRKSYFPKFWDPNYVFTKVNPHRFKKGLEMASKDVIERLKSLSVSIKDPEELSNIATISCNNDRKMGKLISDIYETLGPKAKILRSPDPSTIGRDTIDISTGYSINRGFASPTFADKKGNTVSEMENPVFALFDYDLDKVEDILPYLEYVFTSKKPLVVIAHDFDDKILDMLVKNHLRGAPKGILAIKAPGMGQPEKSSYIEDIAAMIQYDLEESTQGRIKDGNLGVVDRITSSAGETTLILPEVENIMLDNHLSTLSDSLGSLDDFSLKRAEERISKLQGKIGIISLFAKTEPELLERADRLDDAIESTKAAISEGYIAGGGIPLYRISEELEISSYKRVLSQFDPDVSKGYKTLLEAIKMPFITIVTNGGENPKEVMKKIEGRLNGSDAPKLLYSIGYNPLTDKATNLISDGIIDPVKVTRLALENAVSASGSLLTTGCTITLP